MTSPVQIGQPPIGLPRRVESPPERRPGVERIQSLDALRGIAALSVVFAHALWFLKGNVPLHVEFHTLTSGHFRQLSPAFLWELSPLHLLTAGHEAVVLFFVLSGFVIYLPWEAGHGLTYRTYIVRRICRIYLPYLAAVFAAILLNACLSTGGLQEMNAWFNNVWKLPVRAHDVMVHVVMLGSFNTDVFLPPMWSLVDEMRISFVFPLLALLVRQGGKVFPVALALSIVGLLADRFLGGPGRNYFITIHYAALFLLGGWLASRRGAARAWMGRFSARRRGLFLAVSLLAYAYGRFASALWPAEPAVADVVVAAGATGVLVWALRNPRWLHAAPAQWLGQVSYGLYLTHFTVYLSAIYLLHRLLPPWAILVVSLPISLAVTHVFWRFVERPCIRLGRALTR